MVAVSSGVCARAVTPGSQSCVLGVEVMVDCWNFEHTNRMSRVGRVCQAENNITAHHGIHALSGVKMSI
jgi:hypothetical protein